MLVIRVQKILRVDGGRLNDRTDHTIYLVGCAILLSTNPDQHMPNCDYTSTLCR